MFSHHLYIESWFMTSTSLPTGVYDIHEFTYRRDRKVSIKVLSRGRHVFVMSPQAKFSTYTGRHIGRDVNSDHHAIHVQLLASRIDVDHVTVSWERLEGF